MRGNLKILLDIYKPQGVDWMGFAVSTNNSHRYLNWLQKEDPQLFEWYQWLFTEINMTLKPPEQEHIQAMKILQKHCQNQQGVYCLNFAYSKKE